MSSQNLFFSYSWYIEDDEKEVTSMRIYGLNQNNENVCVRVDNFTPYIYIELPNNIKWTPVKAQLVGDKIDKILGNKKPIKKALMYKKRLYGAYIDIETKNRIKFPYLFCSFSHKNDIKTLSFKLRNTVHVIGLGSLQLKMHESDADPILQLTCCRNIPTSGWIKFYGKEIVNETEKLTLCDHEYKVKWKNLHPYESSIAPKPKIMGFDIEVNSTNPSAMPKAEKPGDKIFQISCVISREGDSEDKYENYLLTLGNPDQKITGDDVLIYMYETEAALLEGFTNFIREENPNIIVGYNILGFDIPYMIARAKLNMCIYNFDQQGFHKYAHAKEKIIKWSSSAYKDQEFEFLDAEGRLYVDLLPLVRRDYKFNNYKLKTISEYFIGQTKDPLSVKGIFKCYRIGVKKDTNGNYSNNSRKAMAIVGKYCVQDSALVVKLMDKLKTWIGLTEMAKTCNVPIFTLYTQGQQIKVYSQLYRYCMYENIVVEKDGYQVSEGERYVGAKVFPPKPGKYSMVVPFDFASLYPTTIIAYNIDYHTWVPPGHNIPDDLCHVMKWEDHLGCEHDPKVVRKMELNKYIEREKEKIKKIREKRNKTLDKLTKKELMGEITLQVDKLKPYISERSDITKTITKFPMCAKREYKFLKEPKGVMPTVIQNLLDARKHTRKVDMLKCKEEIKKLGKEEQTETIISLINSQKTLLDVLNKRQLAFKISANSMYGAMGVRRGYLPFMPGAMCTTYMGRVNIEIVAKTIPKKFGGELIYGDTDSNYIHFPKLKTAQQTWDYAFEVASKVTKLFPDPIKLEFEEEIYAFFFILSKKRYMYRRCFRDGLVENKIGKKGVILARRDNSQFVRGIYEEIINKIADNELMCDIVSFVLDKINKLCSGSFPLKDFVITKSVGNCGTLEPVEFFNEKGQKKGKVGNYTVPLLLKDKEEREKQLLKKEAKNDKDFYLLCLPSQVQLAERMKKRGQRVDAGTRLEYIVTNRSEHTAKQYEKIEHVDYVEKHKDLIKVDYLYYLKALANPLDQVLNVAFQHNKQFKSDLVLDQYKYRWKIRGKLLKEVKNLFKPKLTFKT
jgi:DNA polymerase elongation subunit (family B)